MVEDRPEVELADPEVETEGLGADARPGVVDVAHQIIFFSIRDPSH